MRIILCSIKTGFLVMIRLCIMVEVSTRKVRSKVAKVPKQPVLPGTKHWFL